MGFARFMFGSAIGGGFGYLKFGDRQKLHNAYDAERLRRRKTAAVLMHISQACSFSHGYRQYSIKFKL